jgi:xanthine dehydrogenase accessory factor
MLMHEDGRFVGSVSGGCVEGDVLETAAMVIASGTHQAKRYGTADGAVWRLAFRAERHRLIQPSACVPPDLFDQLT